VSSGCGCRRRPPDTEGSCENIEYVVAESRQVVVLQLWGWAVGYTLLAVKSNSLLRNVVLEKYGRTAGCCEHGDETSGSIRGGEFLD